MARPPISLVITAVATCMAVATPAGAARGGSPYRGAARAESSRTYYALRYGVDNLRVQSTASGNLIRFSYRVVDAARASALGDERATPVLYGQRSRALLRVPAMENIGDLRQAKGLEGGKDYWMVFSNKGNLVRIGDRVDVVVGPFRVEGLVVE